MAKQKPKIQHAEIVQHFAAKLRELRHSRGMTQAELAGQAKVTVSYVARLEAAGAAPGIDLVGRLADALGTTVGELLPTMAAYDEITTLRDRARKLADQLISGADRETLLMICPLLARLGESPTRRR